ncbi:hypothetical protein SAMN02745202_01682 [Segatella oulorum]|uniref:Uncharacterized protein n=1 Tax=Segatella oulorum TaxID=28136 RepID=A0A1T4Q480_9BACT|nr:hypothetical protein SAMN02745202_01682 [Segatella oulorum]
MCTVFPTNKQNHPHAIHPNETNRPTHNPPKRYQPLHAICPNETVGAVPACPPERPRSGVSIPKTHALCAGDERWMYPRGATQAGTQAPPLPTSTKPCGVPLPHRGYTFDSAGLASATQPTLGNDASEEATPLGVVLFLITHHYHTRRIDYSRMISPHEN